jgi:hypothetical protein
MLGAAGEKTAAANRSADWERVATPLAIARRGTPAECNSAIQQIPNLRYVMKPPGERRRPVGRAPCTIALDRAAGWPSIARLYD